MLGAGDEEATLTKTRDGGRGAAEKATLCRKSRWEEVEAVALETETKKTLRLEAVVVADGCKAGD